MCVCVCVLYCTDEAQLGGNSLTYCPLYIHVCKKLAQSSPYIPTGDQLHNARELLPRPAKTSQDAVQKAS